MMKSLKKKTSAWKMVVSVIAASLFFVAVACQEQLYEANSEMPDPSFPANIPVDVKTRFETLKATYPSSEFLLLQLDKPESRVTIEKIQERARLTDRQVRVSIIKPSPENKEVGTLGILEIGPKAQGTSGNIYTIVDESATPLWGMKEFFKLIAEQIQYPDDARRLGIEGRVFVEFTVNEDGHLSDFNVVKGLHESTDAEALRVLMLAPPWHPGHNKGKVVRQKMVLPINFMLAQK